MNNSFHVLASLMNPELWQRAVSFAARRADQRRKDGETPYVAHPFRVALTVRHLFAEAAPVALCLALLHHVIEDTPTDFDDVQELIGTEIGSAEDFLTTEATEITEETKDFNSVESRIVLSFLGVLRVLRGQTPTQAEKCRFGHLLKGGPLLLVLAGCAARWEPEKMDGGFRSSVAGAGSYGPISGYMQTPSGGNPGTTSHHRPTFRELNMDDALSYQAAGTLHWGQMGLYGGAKIVHLAEEATLDESLISQATVFPGSSRVHADVKLDTYHLGYRHRLAWVNQAGTRLTLSPAFGAALFDFDYQVRADGGLSADRSYVVASPQLGVSAEWLHSGPFSVAAEAASSLPGVGNLFLFTSEIIGRYRLWGAPDRGGTAFLGVGFERLDYEDNQSVPNHIRADLGPHLTFGLRVGF